MFSYTDPAEQIFSYQPWLILSRNERFPSRSLNGDGRVQSWLLDSNIVNLVTMLTVSWVEIFVASEQLAALEENEFYWHELEGLAVRNLLGESLGVVGKLMETGANDVLLVEDECDGTQS